MFILHFSILKLKSLAFLILLSWGLFLIWFDWLSIVFGQPFFIPKINAFFTPIFHGQPVLAIFDDHLRFLGFAFWTCLVFLTSPFLTFSVCFCRKDCFTSLYFKGCVEMLLLTDESKEIFQMVETVGRKWGRTI